MPATARKFNHNSNSKTRNSMIAAVQIQWQQMRPDLRGDKEALREERLLWIGNLLKLKRPLTSLTALSDKQLGLVLDEMRKLSGQSKPAKSNTKFGNYEISKNANPAPISEPSIVHLASEEQIFTINKLVGFIGWSEERFREFIFKKTRRKSPRLLTYKAATGFTMILLTIAADKALRSIHGQDARITRKMIAEHIPVVKSKLQIDKKESFS